MIRVVWSALLWSDLIDPIVLGGFICFISFYLLLSVLCVFLTIRASRFSDELCLEMYEALCAQIRFNWAGWFYLFCQFLSVSICFIFFFGRIMIQVVWSSDWTGWQHFLRQSCLHTDWRRSYQNYIYFSSLNYSLLHISYKQTNYILCVTVGFVWLQLIMNYDVLLHVGIALSGGYKLWNECSSANIKLPFVLQ